MAAFFCLTYVISKPVIKALDKRKTALGSVEEHIFSHGTKFIYFRTIFFVFTHINTVYDAISF